MPVPPPVQFDNPYGCATLGHPSPAPPALRARRVPPRPTTRAQSALLAATAAALTCAAVSLPLWAPAISVTDLIAALTSSPTAYAAVTTPPVQPPLPALNLAGLPPPAAGPAQEDARRAEAAPAAGTPSTSALSEMEAALDMAFLLVVACTFLMQRQPLGVKLKVATVGSAALLGVMALLHWGAPASKAVAWLCA